MSNNNQISECELLKRIEGKQLKACEVGMLHYNGIYNQEDLNSVVDGIYDIIIRDTLILRVFKGLQVVKTEHGVNVYAVPFKAKQLGFKCADTCELASIVAKRLGSLFPNYTTDATRNGAFTQHLESNRKYGIPLKYRYLTMVSPALLIHEGFEGRYRKQKTKSKVLETYRGLD